MSEALTTIKKSSPRNERILIVDDEYLHAEYSHHVLAEAGYTIVGVECRSDQAQSTIESMKPDIVLLDVRFNDEPALGIDIAKNIRKCEAPGDWMAPYFVFLTGYGTDEIRSQIRGFSGGMYLTKPIAESDLVDAVETAAERLNQIRDAQWAIAQLQQNGFDQCAGSYVAVYRRQVVDNDDDYLRLLQRSAKALGVSPSRIVIEYKGDG